MTIEKQEKLTDEEMNPESDVLTDLAVTDAQAQQAKGGPTLNFTKIEYKYTPYDDNRN